MNYWIIKSEAYDDSVYLSALPTNGPEHYLYSKGVTLADSYPDVDNAIMCFDSNYMDSVKLYDFVENMDGVLIANSKVKTLFEQLGVDCIEYLPTTFWDHKKRIASQDYYIFNVLSKVDAMDMEESEYRMGRLIKDQISRIKKLVLSEDRIPEDAKIFRLLHKTDEYVVSDEVKNILDASGVTGVRFIPAEGWDGLDF